MTHEFHFFQMCVGERGDDQLEGVVVIGWNGVMGVDF